jgi:uncharacterized protein (UPF0548 family)
MVAVPITSEAAVILTRKPDRAFVETFLAAQHDRTFSYPEVGATRDKLPRGYFLDHRLTRLGTGREDFARACQALRGWEQYDIGWVELTHRDTPLEAGQTVAIVAGRLGLWTLNACRIVYAFDEQGVDLPDRRGDEQGSIDRFGFAYGTLTDHVERGEERFTIEWRHDDDSVWYDLLAFSWPNHFITQCGLPYVRRVQKRFAIDSAQALLRSVARGRRATVAAAE